MSFSIIGTGSFVPSCVKTNDELSEIVETTDEWIKSRTGIEKRHICTDEKISDMAYYASIRALEDAKTTADEIDVIICATVCGDYLTPSLSCIVQNKLGATCPSFDVNAACSGFIYALDVAVGYFARKKAKKILVICAEAMTKLVDWNDRATCVLFGDGAGAVVLSQGDDLLSISLTADGNTESLKIPRGTGNCPFSPEEAEGQFLYMNGQEVYRFAVSSMCNDIVTVANEANIDIQDIDYILPHQANIRIIHAAQSRLKIDKEKFLTNINNYGNTSSVSIPILLDEVNRSGKFKNGDILAFSAFGGGFTTGACIIRWNK